MLRSCYRTTFVFTLGGQLSFPGSAVLGTPLIDSAFPGGIVWTGQAVPPRGLPAHGRIVWGNVYINVPIRWYFCDKNAEILPFPTAFCSAIWDMPSEFNPVIGEQHHWTFTRFFNGRTPVNATGQGGPLGQCGSRPDFANGVEITNGIAVDEDQIPLCCGPFQGLPADGNIVWGSSPIYAVGNIVFQSPQLGPALNGNATGGFSIVPTQNLGTGINAGNPGWAFIAVLITDQSAAPNVTTVAQGLLTPIAHIAGPTHGTHNSDLYLFAVPWTGAAENVGVTSSVATDGMIFVVWFPFVNVAGTPDLSVSASGSVPPMDLSFGANATLQEAYLAAFAFLGTAAAPTWPTAFQPIIGSTVHATYDGVQWWLECGYLISAIISAQTATDNPTGGADWSGLGVSYY